MMWFTGAPAGRHGLLVMVGTVSLMLSGPALADSLVDNLNPRSIGMGETMRGSAHAGLSTSLNPAGLALSRQLVFEGTFGFRPEDGGTGFSASACDATVPLPGCFYYQYFSASPEIAGDEFSRRVHEVGSLFARQLSDFVFAGVNIKYFDYRSGLPGEDDDNGFAFDVGTVIRAGDHVDLGVAGYNIYAQGDPAQYPRGIGSGIAVRPTRPLAIGLDGVWNLQGEDSTRSGRYGLGAEYFLTTAGGQSGIPIRAGGVYDAGRDASYVTGGLGYVTRSVGLDAGARYQVDGGDELMLLVSVRLFGPALE